MLVQQSAIVGPKNTNTYVILTHIAIMDSKITVQTVEKNIIIDKSK
jgi:hypothetical protein